MQAVTIYNKPTPYTTALHAPAGQFVKLLGWDGRNHYAVRGEHGTVYRVHVRELTRYTF